MSSWWIWQECSVFLLKTYFTIIWGASVLPSEKSRGGYPDISQCSGLVQKRNLKLAPLHCCPCASWEWSFVSWKWSWKSLFWLAALVFWVCTSLLSSRDFQSLQTTFPIKLNKLAYVCVIPFRCSISFSLSYGSEVLFGRFLGFAGFICMLELQLHLCLYFKSGTSIDSLRILYQ